MTPEEIQAAMRALEESGAIETRPQPVQAQSTQPTIIPHTSFAQTQATQTEPAISTISQLTTSSEATISIQPTTPQPMPGYDSIYLTQPSTSQSQPIETGLHMVPTDQQTPFLWNDELTRSPELPSTTHELVNVQPRHGPSTLRRSMSEPQLSATLPIQSLSKSHSEVQLNESSPSKQENTLSTQTQTESKAPVNQDEVRTMLSSILLQVKEEFSRLIAECPKDSLDRIVQDKNDQQLAPAKPNAPFRPIDPFNPYSNLNRHQFTTSDIPQPKPSEPIHSNTAHADIHSTQHQPDQGPSPRIPLHASTPVSTHSEPITIHDNSKRGHSTSLASHEYPFMDLKLDKLSLPTFDGDLTQWISFRDQFVDLVHNNPRLTPIVKFTMLRNHLKGLAADAINGFKLSSADYDTAWHIIMHRYNRTDRIIEQYLRRFTDLPRLHAPPTAPQLIRMANSANQLVRVLPNLGQNVDTWDTWILFNLKERLDPATLTKWLDQTKGKQNLKLSEFIDFLEFEASENITVAEKKTSHQPRKHYQKPSVHLSTEPKTVQRDQIKCAQCNNDHPIFRCHTFRGLSVKDRAAKVKSAKLCHKCLKAHEPSTCAFPPCPHCQKDHNSLLCYKKEKEFMKIKSPENQAPARENSGIINNITTSIEPVSPSKHVQTEAKSILATAQAKVENARNPRNNIIRALCDNGSQLNLITEKAVKRLGLIPETASIVMSGANDSELGATRGQVTLSIQVPNSEITIPVTLYIVKRVSRLLPKVVAKPHEELSSLSLADPTYSTPGEIDALFGIRVWLQILENQLIKTTDELAVAQKTKLGWVVLQVRPEEPTALTPSIAMITQDESCHSNAELNQILRKFWEIEDGPNQHTLSPDEKYCEQHFTETHSRNKDGRYVVRMPLDNHKIKLLGKSKGSAIRQFLSTERRMERNPEFGKKYREFMKEFLELNHMEEVPNDVEDGYYTPHHGIMSAGKFRTVFNSSHPTSSGLSLNECQYTGPKLQTDLPTVLTRFRKFKFVITADIEKMYRQIEIHPDDRKFQKIIWRDSPDKELKVYNITRIAYGQAAAPYLALKTLKQCAHDYQGQFPTGSQHILTSFYVDDLLTGADSEEELVKIQHEIVSILGHGCLPLAKWCSNIKDPDQDRLHDLKKINHQSQLPLGEEDHRKILGLHWKPFDDILEYKYTYPDCDTWTKRKVVSHIGTLFDPNGFLAPLIISAKIFIQDLWKRNLDWDDPLPESLNNEWNQLILLSADTINQQTICRWLQTAEGQPKELHIFSDASEKAYGASAYIWTRDEYGRETTMLIQSKTRVAPVKPVTIPRLELCGALLAAQLYLSLKDNFPEVKNVHFWTDSTTVLRWLNKTPDQLKTFVANRVAEIQEKTILAGHKWRWTPGADNPADLASRGNLLRELDENQLWFFGPEWLCEPNKKWPQQPVASPGSDDEKDNELKPLINKITVGTSLTRGPWFKHKKGATSTGLLDTYSNFRTLHNAMTGILRAKQNFKAKGDATLKTIGPASPEERHASLQALIRMDQQTTLQKEIHHAEDNVDNKPRDKTLFLEPEEQILRYNGRIQSSNLSYDEKFPVFLSHKGRLAQLLMKQAHQQLLHGGAQQVLQLIRQNFWISRGRRLAKSVINGCGKCFRYSLRSSEQLMAPLPTSRTTPSRPFKICSVDYMGPVNVSARAGRNPPITKGYICVFICHATRAVHLEVATNQSTEQFIAALRRMIARRGPVQHIFSDNGTNFVGAVSLLETLLETGKWANHHFKTKWTFQTPASPHQGGYHEAAVKRVKHHLLRIMGEQNFTFDELNTLITQIEACINSRPLAPMSDDPQDLTALTPGHFLVGENLTTLVEPRPLLDANPNSLRDRYERTQYIYQQLWERWSKEYVNTLIKRTKWTTEQRNVKKDDMVLLMHDKQPPTKWSLGRITKTYPGPDGLVRSVQVRTQTGLYDRPVTKIALIEPFNQ